MTEETKQRLRKQLEAEIEFKIQLLEKRAAVHAQTMYPIKDLELKSPDYGLGIIPKLIAISNSNEESERVIEECLSNKKKLLFIKKYLYVSDPQYVAKCLANNKYARMTITQIGNLLANKTTENGIDSVKLLSFKKSAPNTFSR